jgi:hypothetical protein
MDAGNVKELMAEYYRLQKMSHQMVALRKRIISELKKHGMTGTAFRFNDRTIKYAEYYRYAEISKEHVREVLSNYYPNIDAEQFIVRLWSDRHRTRVETIRTYQKGGKGQNAGDD